MVSGSGATNTPHVSGPQVCYVLLIVYVAIDMPPLHMTTILVSERFPS